MPVGILALSWFAYSSFAIQAEKEPSPPPEEQTIRTEVVEVRVQDYPVFVTVHGVVQPHDQVDLSPQVAGEIVHISPSFEAGAYFAKGDVLIELDSKNYEIELAIAKAEHLRAKSSLKLASLNEERYLKQVESNAISQAEVERAAATREQAEATLASTLARQQRAELDLKRTKIVAPFDGRVRRRNVGLGQMVGPDASLGGVFAVDFAEVRLPIGSRELQFLDLPEFEDDPPIDIQLTDSINDDSGAVWNARIVRTEGELDEESRELFAIARIPDPFGRNSDHSPLRMGQPVTALISGTVLKGVVPLPRVAVRQLDRINLIDRETLTLIPKTIESIWSDEQNVIVRDPSINDRMLISTTHLVYAPNGAKVEIVGNIKSIETIGLADK